MVSWELLASEFATVRDNINNYYVQAVGDYSTQFKGYRHDKLRLTTHSIESRGNILCGSNE